MKRLDQHIARYIDQIPNPIITLKRLGAVITAGIPIQIGSNALRALDHKLFSSL